MSLSGDEQVEAEPAVREPFVFARSKSRRVQCRLDLGDRADAEAVVRGVIMFGPALAALGVRPK
ncbi:hypothetical protein AB0J40_39510 [Amycolatopsis sp. NPDC049691]|uniref:hypothetical protein n=1 Tax=Amycolatopsis sp. NPDC049691 TaxID=3155155 RepID=UPI0034206F6F